MKLHRPLALATLLTLSALASAQDKPEPKSSDLPLDKQQALISANQDSLVIVEYHLQYDKGEQPSGSGFSERCPNCGQFHGEDIQDVIKEERPLEKPGILIDNTHIITRDLQIHPRFIKEIKVRRFNPSATGLDSTSPSISAKISAYPKNQNAILLELSAPLADAKPATFDPKKPGPYSTLSLDQADGRWVIGLQSTGGGITMAGNKPLTTLPSGLILDKDATPIAISTGIEVPADGSWKTSPANWPTLSAADMQSLLAKIDATAAKGIVPVTLNFRDPKKAAARTSSFRGREEDDENAAVQHVLGVVTGPNSVLVLAELKPSTTARLERIHINTDPPVDATFKATLTDYGAFVAESQSPFPAPSILTLSTADLSAAANMQGALLPAADISLHGEQRISYIQPRRIASFSLGWKGNIYPDLAGSSHPFLFDTDARLLALPISHREKPSTAERYGGGRSSDPLLTPIKQLAIVLGDLKTHSDPNNVPLTESQENRLAWLGVEMQGLTPELARANKLSDQTQDGETGGLVTYIYPDSPAAKAGIETGWILLRLSVAGEPKPIDVKIDPDRYADSPFPWDRLSEAPESVFDRIPTPWPSVETPLVRTLTDLGFGKTFTAEFAHDGKIDRKDFTVTQGPISFDAAAKFKSEPLGLTVRNLTYEVRRYMQKKDDEPGVVISKIEMGCKASVAGLKPYEIITHINDQEVKSVADFERLTKNQPDLRLAIKRMTAGRIVKVSIPPTADSQPANQ